MGTASSVSLSIFSVESVNSSTLFNFYVCSCPSSSVHEHLTVTIPFGIISFPSIVYTPLEMMGSILSVNMYSSEHI